MIVFTVVLCVLLFYWFYVWSTGYWLQPGYIKRWHLIPRNTWRNVYLHKIVGPDNEPYPHDHPWAFTSLILSGGYIEELYDFTPATASKDCRMIDHAWENERYYKLYAWPSIHIHEKGHVVRRRSWHAHRIINLVTKPTWTVILTGETKGQWGFYLNQYYSDQAVALIEAGVDTAEDPGPDIYKFISCCDFFKRKVRI